MKHGKRKIYVGDHHVSTMLTTGSRGMETRPKTAENSSRIIAHTKNNNMLPNTAIFEYRLRTYKGWQSFGALPPMHVEMASSYTSAGMLGTSRGAEGFQGAATGQGTQTDVQQDMSATAFAT